MAQQLEMTQPIQFLRDAPRCQLSNRLAESELVLARLSIWVLDKAEDSAYLNDRVVAMAAMHRVRLAAVLASLMQPAAYAL
jgi:hypothetical protein